MHFNSGDRTTEMAGDRLVGHSLNQKGEHLSFALRQSPAPRCLRRMNQRSTRRPLHGKEVQGGPFGGNSDEVERAPFGRLDAGAKGRQERGSAGLEPS